MFIAERTEYKVVQAFIGHVLVDQHSFISFNATTKKLDKIAVLKFVNQYNFVFELHIILPAAFILEIINADA